MLNFPENLCDMCGLVPATIKVKSSQPKRYPPIKLCDGCNKEDEALNAKFRKKDKWREK